jgi:hypothetical protein
MKHRPAGHTGGTTATEMKRDWHAADVLVDEGKYSLSFEFPFEQDNALQQKFKKKKSAAGNCRIILMQFCGVSTLDQTNVVAICEIEKNKKNMFA